MIRRYSQQQKNQQENGESPLFSMLCDPKSPCASAVVARVISLSYMFYTRVVKRCLPRIARLAVSCSLVLVAACAANRGGGAESEYVEVPNPGVTMYPNAPATIWVPRKSVESGIPRGGELLKQGYAKATTALENAPQGEKPGAVAPYAVSATMPLPVTVSSPQLAAAQPLPKSRIAVLESGDNGLLTPFSARIGSASVGILIDQQQPAFSAKYAVNTSPAERGDVAMRLQQEYGANVAVFISATEKVAPGKSVRGAVYNCLGGVLVRTVSARIPLYAVGDSAARDSALDAALAELASNVKYVVALLPWYGKVIERDGDRAYINAGKESGLRIGQILSVYHGGKVIPGLGFTPDERISILEIRGFIGTDGAYGVVKDSKGIRANDLVSVE
jgi:hypothetical protein